MMNMAAMNTIDKFLSIIENLYFVNLNPYGIKRDTDRIGGQSRRFLYCRQSCSTGVERSSIYVAFLV